jgi:hypothetical protein
LRVIGCKSILVLQLDKVVYPIESGGILALALKKKIPPYAWSVLLSGVCSSGWL